MSWLTTHILDTSRGMPASDIVVVCEAEADGKFVEVARGMTDADGRLKSLFPAGEVARAGVYRLTFETGSYFKGLQQESIYPRVQILFEAHAGEQHFHILLLISPFGYTTYRGS